MLSENREEEPAAPAAPVPLTKEDALKQVRARQLSSLFLSFVFPTCFDRFPAIVQSPHFAWALESGTSMCAPTKFSGTALQQWPFAALPLSQASLAREEISIFLVRIFQRHFFPSLSADL